MARTSWIIVCLWFACVVSCASATEDAHDDHDDHAKEGHDGHDDHEKEGHDDHEDHDEHEKEGHADHEEHHPWEWSGIFEVSKGHYSWTAARKSGKYAETSMKVLLLSAKDLAPASPSASLKTLAEQGEKMWPNMTFTNRSSGEELTPGFAYNLKFDVHSWITVFTVKVEGLSGLAVFTEHAPTEFEDKFHFFKSELGADVEPVVLGSKPSSSASSDAGNEANASASMDEWLTMLLGAFITCTPTLLGVLFVSCAMKPRLQELMKRCQPSLDSFASGVLFAAAVFLLMPEALKLASSGHDSEVTGTWTWGTAILLGWLTCTLIHHAVSIFFGKQDAKGEVDIEKSNTGSAGTRSWLTIAAPVIFGDFFHNFADGFVLGAAFKNCNSAFAWKLVGVTVIHELPQEIADFFLLINEAGMRWQWATLANFLCSTSTVLGAVITWQTSVGSNEEGYILAYGAGVYLFIAMTELGTNVVNLRSTSDETKALGATSVPKTMDSLRRLVPFAVGCIVIGLVLLSHEHCDAPVAGTSMVAGASDPHAGHGH